MNWYFSVSYNYLEKTKTTIIVVNLNLSNMSRKFFKKVDLESGNPSSKGSMDPPNIGQFQSDTSKGDKVINELARVLNIDRSRTITAEVGRVAAAGEFDQESQPTGREVLDLNPPSVDVEEKNQMFDYTVNGCSSTDPKTKTLNMITDISLMVSEGIERRKTLVDNGLTKPVFPSTTSTGSLGTNHLQSDPLNQKTTNNTTATFIQQPVTVKHTQQSRIPIKITGKKPFLRSVSVDDMSFYLRHSHGPRSVIKSVIDVAAVSSLAEISLLKKKYREKKHSSGIISDLDTIEKKIKNDIRVIKSSNESIDDRLVYLEHLVLTTKRQIRSNDLDLKLCQNGIAATNKQLGDIISRLDQHAAKLTESYNILATLRDDIIAKIDLTEGVFRTTEARILDTLEAASATNEGPSAASRVRLTRKYKDIQDRVKAMACKKELTMTQLRAEFPTLSDAIDTGDEQSISNELIAMGEEDSERYII